MATLTYPSPFEAFRALRKSTGFNDRKVIAATILPRATWNGDGYDVCWTGSVITEKTDRSSLTVWDWTARRSVHDDRGVTVGLYEGRYDIARTPAGVGAAVLSAKCPGQWHMPNSRNVWCAIPNAAKLTEWVCHHIEHNPAGEE